MKKDNAGNMRCLAAWSLGQTNQQTSVLYYKLTNLRTVKSVDLVFWRNLALLKIIYCSNFYFLKIISTKICLHFVLFSVLSVSAQKFFYANFSLHSTKKIKG